MSLRIVSSLVLVGVIAFIALGTLFLTAFAQTAETKWNAPASEGAKRNPIAANQSSIAAGEKIYTKRCVACHGTSGNGDGQNAIDLGIHPAKLSEVTSGEADGALFWKITTGKKPMPSYRTRLSDADRWNVINYVRTLEKK